MLLFLCTLVMNHYDLYHYLGISKPKSIEKEPDKEKRYSKHNTEHREKRAKNRIKTLQVSLNIIKKANRKQETQIEVSSEAIEEYKAIISQHSSVVQTLKKTINSLEETIVLLDTELSDLREQTRIAHKEHEAEVQDLTEQISQLQEHQTTELSTFSSRAYTTHVRELYYSLLSLKLPPGKIKPIIQNVISHLLPHAKSIRLPGKSCASYMRSHEMPTLSGLQKSSELEKSKEWHLSSDGTTLKQQKKMAFLINGLVFGIHDVVHHRLLSMHLNQS